MRKITLIFVFCTFICLMSGCDPFKYPTGTWTCDELSMTLNFDDTLGGFHRVTDKDEKGIAYDINGRGTIIIDGVSLEIICMFRVSGTLEIGYPYQYGEYDENGFREDWLFKGYMEYMDKNKFNYIIVDKKNSYRRTGEQYIFIRQD